MAYDNPEDRPVSQDPCIYWSGSFCTANSKFSIEEISCYNDGNCNGFGTCRGCSEYDQGGLKLYNVDGVGGITQAPMNVQMYNLRAQMAPCCFWGGPPEDVEEVGDTRCTITAAVPWQSSFSEENPTAYPCNGAKPECPYYTGPEFTEVVDSKMDMGNRVTAKQIMELRYYSRDWKDETDPRKTWEEVFEQPDIWAWVRGDSTGGNTPGPGKFDTNGNPLIQKVTINTFNTDEPRFVVDAPRGIATGTPVVGGPPDYPTFVRELNLLVSDRLEVIWPKNTSIKDPFVRKTFTPGDAVVQVSVLVHSDNELVAINITKHTQGGVSDTDFIASVKRDAPDDVFSSFVGGFPGANFRIPLEYGGSTSCLNHIKIFLAAGETGTEYITKDIYVLHKFYHAHIAQTKFHDLYGHTMIDPWINHFTRIEISADVLHLTNNTAVKDVFWHTTASNGKKTLYAVEFQREVSSDTEDSEITWEPLHCGYIAVTFNTPNVNRVFPWKAWETDSKGAPLYVKVLRENHPDLPEGAPETVEMEFFFASTAGSVIPPNVAIYRPVGGVAHHPFDVAYDTVSVRYAYTEYKQGPIPSEDIDKLKVPADVTKVIELLPYGIDFNNDSISIDGTFLRVGDSKIYSCDDVIGDCYTKAALTNEKVAGYIFKEMGGVREETLQKHHEMVGDCADLFMSNYGGSTFEDGTAVSFSEVANRLGDMHLTEGSQHYSIVFEDVDGIPIGHKDVAFLTQSAMVQARDVEIRYKWVAPSQHWPLRNTHYVFATWVEPFYPHNSDNLIHQLWLYDPFCGDHSDSSYGAFDLSIDKHGALWYPYTRCRTPKYNPEDWWVTPYEDIVEGFGDDSTDNRRDYWERMRYYDKYTPAIFGYIGQDCCCWSTSTTNLEVMDPPSFVGWTKIRSLHPQGPYSTDRESIRVSRHYEKRNLEIETETITQEDGGWTLELTSTNNDALYDEDGNLKTGVEMQTPVWVHISDGMNVVNFASEDRLHPFANLLLERVGSYVLNEQFSEERLDLHEVMEERDLTRSTERNPDGTKVYLSSGTEINTASGTIDLVPGTDIKWVYKNTDTTWVWMAEPREPERNYDGIARIGGLFVSNPSSVIFKKNLHSASHVLEGLHTIHYTPHQFKDDGTLLSAAKLTLDGGPHLYISQNTGWVYILSSETSPYDPAQHIGEDYQFVLHGKGPDGIGILADSRGLQRYETGGVKYATFAGVSINLTFDINELPYEVFNISQLNRPIDTDVIGDLVQEYGSEEITPIGTELIDFKGHYYVETVAIDFLLENGVDIPVVEIDGMVKGSTSITTLFSSSYSRGDSVDSSRIVRRLFAIKRRLTQIEIRFGARRVDAGMKIQKIDIQLRDHIECSEKVFIYGPKVQRSTGNTGTHKPSDLEFYFERVDPDFSKSYVSGQLSVGDLAQGQGITKIPDVEIKYSTRRVKDLISQFEFTDQEGSRFPYDNIDFSDIADYVSETTAGGTYKFIDSPVQVCSKGWTMCTNEHEDDPYRSLTHENSFPELLAEYGQKKLYQDGAELLGDKVTVFHSFWHPEEISFFAQAGVDLRTFECSLELHSTVAPIDCVFRHESYGCIPSVTNENLDGTVHEIENWQARGAFQYHSDPGFNYTCFRVIMSKNIDFLFLDYTTSSYLDNNVVNRFSYIFSIPPGDGMGYITAGLIDKTPGGRWGGPIANPAYMCISQKPPPPTPPWPAG